MMVQYLQRGMIVDEAALRQVANDVKHFCIDSRLVQRGSLFFALKGERSDGHDYLKMVAEFGGRGAVVSKGYAGEAFGLELFFVEDVAGALQELARARLRGWDVPIVGITGSVGKTTTKEFLAPMLATHFRTFKSPFSYNSQVTLPLNVLNAKGDEEVLVLEMAMSQEGEIRRLVEIAPPKYAIVTKIARSHTAFFPDGIEGVARAKGEILESPCLCSAVVSKEAMQFAAIRERGGVEKITYGETGATYSIERRGERYVVFERGEASPEFDLQFHAEHLCANFLAAVAMSRTLGLAWEEILSVAPTLTPPSKRFEQIVRHGVTFINDSYNASAESTVAALKNLPRPSGEGKTIFVFGEMRELGDHAEESHRDVGIAAVGVVDSLLCLGELCKPTMEVVEAGGKSVASFRDLESLKKTLFQMTSNGDVVLIKGANSHQLWRILDE